MSLMPPYLAVYACSASWFLNASTILSPPLEQQAVPPQISTYDSYAIAVTPYAFFTMSIEGLSSIFPSISCFPTICFSTISFAVAAST